MKLKQLSVTNVRSFGERRTVHFHDDFTILIGPNAGGKSNLLDIITVAVRKFFLRPWGLARNEDSSGPYLTFTSADPFENVAVELAKFDGANGPSIIEFERTISAEDIASIQSVTNRLDRFRKNAKHIRNGEEGLTHFSDLRASDFQVGESLAYRVEDSQIASLSGQKADRFRTFLQHFNKLSYIDELEGEETKLTTPFVHFPPYRGIGSQRLRMSLANQNRWDFEVGYARATSRQAISLIELATHHFASKMRRLESQARTAGFETLFRKDPEVVQVTNTLRKLGYEWDLLLKDELTNTYEITLKKDGRSFEITSASSGEKEIINFILGTFALNVRNGLVVVDEPELHLHPKWQRMLYGVFAELHQATGNQFILATHSPAFITASTVGSLKRVARIGGQSHVIPLDATSLGNRRELLQMINSHNNEKLFFADKVVLVEGIQDRLVFERILDVVGHQSNDTSPADGGAPGPASPSTQEASVGTSTPAEIIEVLEVFGKGNFPKYRDLLESIQVTSFIIADRDYADQVGSPIIKALFAGNLVKVAKNTVGNPKSVDRVALVQKFDKALKSKDWSEVEELWTYIVARQRSLRNHLDKDERRIFDDFLSEERGKRTYILSGGSVEDYLPEGWTTLEKTIELISAEGFESRMQARPLRYKELKDICAAIIKFRDSSRPNTSRPAA